MAKQGKNENTLVDLPRIIESFVKKTTQKRFSLLQPRLQALAEEEAEYLFKYMTNDLDVFGAYANPFKVYSRKPWRPLSTRYAIEKGGPYFWYNDKKVWFDKQHRKRNELLEEWFKKASPEASFGKPYVYMSDFRPRARGLQNITISIRMFPRAEMDAPTWVLTKLFGQRPAGLGSSSRISNEEDRPILSPAMQMLVRYRFNSKARKLIKETFENG